MVHKTNYLASSSRALFLYPNLERRVIELEENGLSA
nr:MAG TPA: hypothetical protein [Caudoviricetes sp.]